MKLIFYELKKVLNKKIFLIFLFLCLLVNGFLLYSFQNTEDNKLRIAYCDEYGALLKEYSNLPLDEAEKRINDEMLVYEISDKFDLITQSDDEKEIEMYSLELEEYKKNNKEVYEKAVKLNKQGGEELWKIQFLSDFTRQFEYIKSYPDFIDEMYERAEEQSGISIFGDENSFSYKNLYKTAYDYASLKDIKLSLANFEAFTETVKYGLTDIFIIAAVFLICIYLFAYEREKGVYPLVRCTKFGRLKTIISKLSVLFVLSAVITLLFISANFIMNTFLYGRSDLNVNIQSISEFRNCAFSVTTGRFLLMFALAKIIAVFVISSVLALVFICFQNSAIMYIVGVAAVSAEYLLYVLIGQNSFLNLLKYFNVFYIFDGDKFFGSYLNLNLFSNAVTAYPHVFAVFAAVFAVCFVLSCVVFCKQNQQKKDNVLAKLSEKIKAKFFKINGSTSVFAGEIFKFTVQNKMAVLLILLVFYAVFSSFGTMSYPYVEFSDAEYEAYMEFLEGDITAEKEQYIAEQEEYFNILENRIIEISENTELSENTKQAMIKSIGNILENKGVAFDRVKEQYNRLLELQRNGVNARFIDERIYSDFVFNPNREWNSFAFLCIVLIVGVPCVFASEYKNKMIDLLSPTKNGKTHLFVRKFSVTLIFTAISFVAAYLPYLIRFINTYGTNSFKTPVVCVFPDLQGCFLSVISTVIINLFGYLLLSVTVASVITAVSIVTKNNMFTMVLSTVIIIIPCLSVYLSQSLRIGHLISNGMFALLIVVCAVSSALLILMTAILEIKFTKSGIRRKKNAYT